ncbi:MAG TPA: hypothetical protein VGO45_01860 [Bacteroidia bacterium]|jgi:hypothetical protein|nr:hypothetical protein [Bacteroidia bacterium]
MNKSLGFFLLSVSSFFFVFQTYSQVSILRTDSLSDEIFFQKKVFAYPWYIQKGKKSKYRNVVTGRKIKTADTLGKRELVTSLRIRYDSLPDRVQIDSLHSCLATARLSGDTLFFTLPCQQNPDDGVLRLSIGRAGLSATMVAANSLQNKQPVVAGVTIYRLIVNQRLYNKGDEFRAELEFSAEYDLNDVARGPYHKKVYYEGWIHCRVQ